MGGYTRQRQLRAAAAHRAGPGAAAATAAGGRALGPRPATAAPLHAAVTDDCALQTGGQAPARAGQCAAQGGLKLSPMQHWLSEVIRVIDVPSNDASRGRRGVPSRTGMPRQGLSASCIVYSRHIVCRSCRLLWRALLAAVMSLKDSLSILSKRWQREPVKQADLVSPGLRGDGVAPHHRLGDGGGAAARASGREGVLRGDKHLTS